MSGLKPTNGAWHVCLADPRPQPLGDRNRDGVGPAIEVRGFRLERARGRVPGLVGDVHGSLHDVSRGADHLRPGDGGTDRNSACAPRFEGKVLQVGDGSVAPHVVGVELRALDADGGERQRHVPGYISPVWPTFTPFTNASSASAILPSSRYTFRGSLFPVA